MAKCFVFIAFAPSHELVSPFSSYLKLVKIKKVDSWKYRFQRIMRMEPIKKSVSQKGDGSL
jgi:hypothetical protein